MKKSFSIIAAIILSLSLWHYSYATSANITCGGQWATIETGSTEYVCTLGGVPATITNNGTVDVEIGWNGQTIGTAGTQVNGQITLSVGMTVPLPPQVTSFSFKSASAGKITYVPYHP